MACFADIVEMLVGVGAVFDVDFVRMMLAKVEEHLSQKTSRLVTRLNWTLAILHPGGVQVGSFSSFSHLIFFAPFDPVTSHPVTWFQGAGSSVLDSSNTTSVHIGSMSSSFREPSGRYS